MKRRCGGKRGGRSSGRGASGGRRKGKTAEAGAPPKRKEQEQLARHSGDQQYSAALGYDQEPRDVSQPSGFNFFGPRRF